MDLLVAAIGPLFTALCVATVALYVVAHYRPRWLTPTVSIPYVFELKRNVGPESYAFQTAIYVVFHRSLFDDICHHFLTLDQVAWAVLAYAWGGWPGLAVMIVLAIVQASTFGENVLTGLVAASWALFAALAVWLVGLLGEHAALVGMATVVASAGLRVIGHAGEPLPPLVGRDTLAFHPLKITVSSVATGFAGWVAEFASGIPYRLFPPQLALMAMRFGWKPTKTPTLAEFEALGAKLGREGWASWPTTRALYAWHPEAAQAPGQA